MDWARKHMVELSSACKKCIEDPTLSMNQRDLFSEIYALAKPISSIPSAGGSINLSIVIAMACGACQGAYHFECTGRYAWNQTCLLLEKAGRLS